MIKSKVRVKDGVLVGTTYIDEKSMTANCFIKKDIPTNSQVSDNSSISIKECKNDTDTN